eukprot:976248_1
MSFLQVSMLSGVSTLSSGGSKKVRYSGKTVLRENANVTPASITNVERDVSLLKDCNLSLRELLRIYHTTMIGRKKSDKFKFVLNAKSVEFTGQCKTTNNEKYCVNTRIAAENPCRTMPMPEAPVAHELSQILKDYGPNGRRDQ